MKHPLLVLASKEQLHDDALRRALNPAKVAAATAPNKPRKLSDGGGLYLLVTPKRKDGKPVKRWRYKYRINGREGLYTLGVMPEIGLADARRIHRAARWLVKRGIHPTHYVREEIARQEAERSRHSKNEFSVVCERWLERDSAKLAASSLYQRQRELRNDVLPTLSARPITSIRKDELTWLLRKIQSRAPEVARNVRQYLVGIFDYAQDAGSVSGSPVPGPKILKPRNQKPHAALQLERVGEFLCAVNAAGCNPQTRIAIHLLLLTAVRKQELIAAKWDEFDMDKAEWIIPETRMKMREPHWVPLSTQAIKLLQELSQYSMGVLLFPNVRNPLKPMAGRSLNAFLGRLGYLEQVKPHGFRAMFSTYFNGVGWNPDVIEKCLAHRSKDTIRRVYNRAEYAQQRREMLQWWADFVDAQIKDRETVIIGMVGKEYK